MTIGRKSSYSTIARQEAHFGPSVGPSSSSSWPHGSSSSSSSSSKPGAVSAASSLVAGTSRRAWDRLNDILRGPESASSTTANSPASPTSREKQRMQRRWGSFSDEEEDTGFPAPSSRGTEYSSASRDDDDDDDHDDRFQDSPRSSSETGSIAGSESSLNLKLASQPHLPLPPSMGRRPTLTFTSPPPTPPFNSTSGGFYGLARGSRSAITLGTPALSSTSLSNYGFPVDHHRHHYTHRPLLDEDNENDVSAAALGGARKVTSAELASLAKGMIPTLCVIGVLFFLSLGIVVGLLRSLPMCVNCSSRANVNPGLILSSLFQTPCSSELAPEIDGRYPAFVVLHHRLHDRVPHGLPPHHARSRLYRCLDARLVGAWLGHPCPSKACLSAVCMVIRIADFIACSLRIFSSAPSSPRSPQFSSSP